jgi:hypothetical protein
MSTDRARLKASVGRVQCARSLLSDAENFATLSPSDLRDLKEALPRCIEKCQRN